MGGIPTRTLINEAARWSMLGATYFGLTVAVVGYHSDLYTGMMVGLTTAPLKAGIAAIFHYIWPQ